MVIGEIFENEQQEEYEEEIQPLDNISKDERCVTIDKGQMSMFELNRRYLRGDIILQPPYQRQNIWTVTKQSRLVESVLLNIPIPVIYLSEEIDDVWEVIDGHQRLHSFFEFLINRYKLSGLTVLKEFNNLHFSDLENKLKRKIEDYQLNVFTIKKESHPDIKFDIFERINGGASSLNAQELRNCVFRGEAIELVKSLSQEPKFTKLIKSKEVQTNRLKEQESVLRFLAFYVKGYESYTGNIKVFLNETLRNFNQYRDQLVNIECIFRETMDSIYKVFGDDAFTKKMPEKRKKFITSIFDIISISFAKYDRKIIVANKEYVLKRFAELMTDDKFLLAITVNTLTKQSVNNRFETWFKVISELEEVK
jgi:hypothetical protein